MPHQTTLLGRLTRSSLMGSLSQTMTTTHTLRMIMLPQSRLCLVARTTTQALPLVRPFPPPLHCLLYVAQEERAPLCY